MNKLNVSKTDNLTYESGILEITILGGIRLEGLDRMKATLKICLRESAVPPLRHTLDLYNDNQVEKLIRKTAVKLEVGTSVTAAVINDLTNELENYRLEELERQNTEKVKSYQLTEAERKEAELYLSAPNLIERTKEDIGRSGVIGEEDNRLLMYLIFTSRKREQPLHIISLGASGTGKTHLQEKVGELIPEEDKLEITSLSENAFYYFERTALSNKLILIEDLDGLSGTNGGGAYYAVRELQSKKRISKTIVHKTTKGETRSVHLQVEGPICVAGCTTKESIYEDNANRSFLIYLNESEQQDAAIMNYQRKASAGKIDKDEENEIKKLLQNSQRVLQPIKVVNPYAELLHIPKEVLKPRRTNSHYLQFIEAVTFYHQKQRESVADTQTGEIYIETTVEDIKEANKLMKQILLRKSDELSGACRSYFEQLKEYLREEKKIEYTNREIRQHLRITGTTLRRYQNELLDEGQISIAKGKAQTGYTYQITSLEAYKALKDKINNVLDEILEQVKCATESVVSQTQNGSPKSKTTNKKSAVSQ